MTTAPSCLSEVLQWVESKQRVGRSHKGGGGQGRDTGKQMGCLGHCTLLLPRNSPFQNERHVCHHDSDL